MNQQTTAGKCLPCKDTETREWYAWNNLQPPPPNFFHIIGEVYVPNPGVEPLLAPTVPQGPNPEILLLDLYLCQKPGDWEQRPIWTPVRYEKRIEKGYKRVDIMCDGKLIASVDVHDVR